MTETALSPKPRTTRVKPELTRLPRLTFCRRVFRRFITLLMRLVVRLFTRVHVEGLENIPQSGPALIVTNHLGDADMVVGLAFAPPDVDTLAKIDLYFDYPLIGWLMDAYGVIWLHRGSPDRRALRIALESLALGRMVAVAPEGRESLTGALEEGTGGAAYLALKAGVPILPATITGTENRRIYANLRRFHRSEITLTIGKTFTLESGLDLHQAVIDGTRTVMSTLARQLPPEYRGVYQE